jgi:hypothetical protein
METITVTPAEIIYHRRVAVLDHAARCGNVSEACRTFGVSRTRYYEWKHVADRYGLDALMPKTRRSPQLGFVNLGWPHRAHQSWPHFVRDLGAPWR